MKLLFIGDIVGRPGRQAVVNLTQQLRQEYEIDAVIANAENAAGGKGLTIKIADSFFKHKVDILTSGNHIWQYKEIYPYLESQSRILRPANYLNAPGHGATCYRFPDGRTLGVISIEGRVFMRNLECPFVALEREISEMSPRPNAILVDVHCEATSEKQALGWYFDGKVSAVIGSHTHVPTADERVLPGGTAFITDVGMTGPYDSVIGMNIEAAIMRLRTQRPNTHQVARDNVLVCGVIVDIDDSTGRAVSIERFKKQYIRPPS